MIPLISIIIPNYNHSRFLKQRLESVYNQTFQDFEVILLDDASTDKSLDILKPYASHPKTSQFVINKQNSGSPFKQWKKGIKLAKGTYIWIAESDDFCELTFLEEIIGFINKNPSLSIAYCQSIDVDEQGKTILHRIEYTNQFKPNIWKESFVYNGKRFVEKYLSEINVIPNASAVLFKKGCVKPNFFSDDLIQMKMCGDWFFWVQLCLNNDIGFFAADLNYFRNHIDVTRNHTNIEHKKNRLLEERIVRSFMQLKGIKNKKREQQLYKQWFSIFGRKFMMSKKIFQIKLKHTSVLNFIVQIMNFKR